MEFKTTQGGETTLSYDAEEIREIHRIAERLDLTSAEVERRLLVTRQANPLAGFTELIGLAYAGHSEPGVAPQGKKKPAPVDPSLELEQLIRRKLASVGGSAVGSTSQSHQAEAILLQALAVCLQTRALVDQLEDIAFILDTIKQKPIPTGDRIRG